MGQIYDLTSSPYPKTFPHGWDRLRGAHPSTLASVSALASLATTLSRLLWIFSQILGKIAKAAGFIPSLGLSLVSSDFNTSSRTVLVVSDEDWRERQHGLCQRIVASHPGKVGASCSCSSEVPEHHGLATTLLNYWHTYRERSLSLHLLCLLSFFCEHSWSLDRAGTHTYSFSSF